MARAWCAWRSRGRGAMRGSAGSSVFPAGALTPPASRGDIRVRRRLPLVIDPILAYSTLLGGTGHDRAYAVAVGSDESAVVTGVAGALDFPTTLGAFDRASGGIFVTKLNASGSALVYSTFLGPGRGTGVALRGGHAYVTGFTFAGGFATAGAVNNLLPGASNA